MVRNQPVMPSSRAVTPAAPCKRMEGTPASPRTTSTSVKAHFAPIPVPRLSPRPPWPQSAPPDAARDPRASGNKPTHQGCRCATQTPPRFSAGPGVRVPYPPNPFPILQCGSYSGNRDQLKRRNQLRRSIAWRISLTACSIPTKRARDTIVWPMFSSCRQGTPASSCSRFW